MFVFCLPPQNLAECRQMMDELQETQADLSSRLEQQKQQLSDVSGINNAFDSEKIVLQDAKEKVSGRSSASTREALLKKNTSNLSCVKMSLLADHKNFMITIKILFLLT